MKCVQILTEEKGTVLFLNAYIHIAICTKFLKHIFDFCIIG